MSGDGERTTAAIIQAPSGETVVAHAQGIINFMQRGYAIWMALYLVLGILTVVLPGLSAIGLFESKTSQALAGAGALSAAIFGFLRPHEYATGFDNAAQIAWQARNDFQLGLIDNIEVARRLGRALALTTFRYAAIGGAASSQGRPTKIEAGRHDV